MKIKCEECGYAYSNEITRAFDVNTSVLSVLFGADATHRMYHAESFEILDDGTIICLLCNHVQKQKLRDVISIGGLNENIQCKMV